MNDFIVMEEILEVGKRLYNKGFVASNDGNISVRLGDGRIMITATGVCKGDLTADDILITDEEGNLLMGDKKPTSEIKMHLAVYKKRSDVNAIVHAHPPKTTAFAVAGLNLDKLTLPEVVFSLGSISFAEYGTPSTQQLPDEISKVITNSDAVILANHGALTVGANVMDAYFKMETLEHFAGITIYARQLGGERELSPEQEKELFRVRSDVFGKKGELCTDCGICTDGKSVKDKVPDCVMAQAKEEKHRVQEDELSWMIRKAVEQQLKRL
jgi:L-fuculose-phosphate aldolase